MGRRIPKDHPLRPMREMVDRALEELSPRSDAVYAKTGRPSIAPERLLRALLLQLLYCYSQRADADGAARLQLAVPLVRGPSDGRGGLGSDGLHEEPRPAAGGRGGRGVLRRGARAGAGEAPAVERALHGGRDADRGVGEPQELPAEGGRGRRGRRRGSGDPTVNFRGERRSNATHQSTSDPDARLARIKGKESKLAYHLLTENRHGLVVDARLTQADGYAERRRSPCWRASRRAARWGRIAASTTRIACSAAARSGSRFTWRS